jgi:hypothetical protein
MVFSEQAVASGVPSLTLFFPYVPIFTYLVCTIIWVIRSKIWTPAKRWLLVIVIFPLFSMAAFFLPLFFVRQDKYFDEVMCISSIFLTIVTLGIFYVSLSKKWQK